MTAKKRSFKSKGTDILKGKPQSMGEFLNDELAGQIKPDTHLHKNIFPQIHIKMRSNASTWKSGQNLQT